MTNAAPGKWRATECTIWIPKFAPPFPSLPPPFAGKSPLLAESVMRVSRRAPILALGQAIRPSGGQHGGQANIL